MDTFEKIFDSSDGAQKQSCSAWLLIDLTGDNSSNSNEGEKLGVDFTGEEERIVSYVDGMFSSIF